MHFESVNLERVVLKKMFSLARACFFFSKLETFSYNDNYGSLCPCQIGEIFDISLASLYRLSVGFPYCLANQKASLIERRGSRRRSIV